MLRVSMFSVFFLQTSLCLKLIIPFLPVFIFLLRRNACTGKEPVPKKPKVEGQPGVKGGGFSQPLPISHALRSFLGCEESGLPRCEVVKRMWAYIKEKNLQVCLGFHTTLVLLL